MNGIVRMELDEYNELRDRLTRTEAQLNMLADTVLESIEYVGNAPFIQTDAVLILLRTFDMDVDGAIEEAKKKRDEWYKPLPIPEDLSIDDDFEIPLEWQPTDDEIRTVRERCGDD